MLVVIGAQIKVSKFSVQSFLIFTLKVTLDIPHKTCVFRSLCGSACIARRFLMSEKPLVHKNIILYYYYNYDSIVKTKVQLLCAALVFNVYHFN